MDAFYLGPLEHFGNWDSVTPCHMEQGPETSHVEGVELLSMSAVDCPSLTGIEQKCRTTAL